jgi:hypothetical protein
MVVAMGHISEHTFTPHFLQRLNVLIFQHFDDCRRRFSQQRDKIMPDFKNQGAQCIQIPEQTLA